MRDYIAAFVSLAIATNEIAELVGGPVDGIPAGPRVFGNKIPRRVIEAADTKHPPKMLVIRQGGGGAKSEILPICDRTVIALCYGETDEEAGAVLRAVDQRFIVLAREIHADVLIHHINPTGGPIPSVEPDLVWPAVAQSYTTKVDILEVA